MEKIKDSIREFKQVPISSIKPYWKNARDNSQAIGPVVESIRKFGYCQPILVDKKNVIVAGHTRYKALLEIGAKTAQVIVVDLPENKIKQYRIIDNKTSEFSKWVEKDLKSELREFENLEKEFQVFFKDDLATLMEEDLGQSKKDVTQKKLDAQKSKMGKKFTDVSRTDQLEVICPHCESEFFINRKDALKAEG